MTKLEKRYTPQDNSCVCGVRIGDHTDGALWVCLDRFCKFYRKINKVLSEE